MISVLLKRSRTPVTLGLAALVFAALVLAVVGLVALAFTGAFFTLALLAVLVFLAAESVLPGGLFCLLGSCCFRGSFFNSHLPFLYKYKR